jgi:hypothetical protein
MFRAAPAAVPPAADIVLPPAELIPLSVLALDLPEPAGGFLQYLAGRGVEVLTDDVGRPSVSRGDDRMLLAERRENEARAREVMERQERQFIERDRQWRAQLSGGVPWYLIPDGVRPAAAMLQAARDESPRRRSLVEDFLDRSDELVFHGLPDEEAS